MNCPRCGQPIPINPGAIFYCSKPNDCYFLTWGNKMTAIRDPLLAEREKTHGSFRLNAEFSQKLKEVMSFGRLERCQVHNEALDMIALKISRIISGQANTQDHWDDIAGYAKLGAEACEG